jgi:predicted negative regulator of RcsB-dependent stress response
MDYSCIIALIDLCMTIRENLHMEEAKETPSKFHFFKTNNVVPLIFSGIIGFVALANYLANLSSKADVAQANIQSFQQQAQNNEKVMNLLNTEISDKINTFDELQKCTAVLSASVSAYKK